MMTDIRQIKLQSGFFAELVKGDYSINNLEYGVIYVKADNDSNWLQAVEKAKRSFATSKERGIWLMKYDVEALPVSMSHADESNVGRLLGEKYNLLMPLFIPHEKDSCFLVGNVQDSRHVEFAAGLLIIDAQNLMVASIPYALPELDMRDMETIALGVCDGSLTDDWANTVRDLNMAIHSMVSFRGRARVNPMAALGNAAKEGADLIKQGKLSYKEQRNKIMDLHKIAKKMRDDDETVQDKAMSDFGAAWTALSRHEQTLIVAGMMKAIKPKTLKGIVALTANREELGAKTKYKVVVRSWNSEYKKYGFDDNCKKCLFIERTASEPDLKEQLYPLKMPKNATVIYTMSLIEKVTKAKKDKYSVVDVKKNNKAFVEIYKRMFDCNTNSVQKGYEELFLRKMDNPYSSLRSGRLSDNYNDIEIALVKVFKELDEDYSPFLINTNTPLALVSEKIELAEDLLEIKIR